MKFFKGLPAVLLASVLLHAVSAQYDYKPPQPPRGTYLPPPNSPPPSQAPTQPPRPPQTPPPNQQEQQIDAEGLNPDGEHEPGMPFDFTYAVKDDVGNDFSHNANSDGDVVKGEYRVALPDGRVQVVKYTADWKNGYNAEVTYEGEARPYEPPPRTPAPFRPENQENIDSQGILPPSKPGPITRPTQPPTYRPAQTLPPRTNPPPTYTQPPRTNPPPPPSTYRPPVQQTTQGPPPAQPPGLYGTPNQPFGVRNNPKFGYNA